MIQNDCLDCIEVLGIIRDGKRPKPWDFRNLSILEFENYIYSLEKNGLIMHHQDTDFYEITTKGIEYLTDFHTIIQLLASKSRKKEQILAH